MPFNSFIFLMLLPLIWGVYYGIPRKYAMHTLLIISYLIYLNWYPGYALLLLGLTLFSFKLAQIVAKRNDKNHGSGGGVLLSLGIGIIILPLIVFKYTNFVNTTLSEFLFGFDIPIELPHIDWIHPVGISFYTFQIIGYIVDVYRKQICPEKNIIRYSLFVSFFPQTAAGPISKGAELLPQFQRRYFDKSLFYRGIRWLIWGYFLKLMLADRLGIYVDTIYDNIENYNGKTCLMAAIFYSFQIYGDFAGYSYMAIGIAATLGFRLINNFNHPYLASCITDFWRRWHISLTRWLTNYIYISLGGNRCSTLKHYSNILITFLVSGIWHGANWGFIVWGLFHGLVQVFEKLIHLSDCKSRLLLPFRIFLTFSIVTLAWIYFRLPTISDANNVVYKIFTKYEGEIQEFSLSTGQVEPKFLLFTFVILFSHTLFCRYVTSIKGRTFTFLQTLFYVFLSFCILLTGVLDSGQFIYVSF